MNYSNVFRLLIIVATVCLLIITMPSTLAQEMRSINIWPTKGKIGDTIRIVGQGFNKSTVDTDKYAAIYFSSQKADTTSDIGDEVEVYKLVKEGVWLDENGEFETTITVPIKLDDGDKEEDVVAGTYYIYVCHYVGTIVSPRIRAVAKFIVTFGEITIDPTSGPVATMVEIKGNDFTDNASITIEYDGSEVDLERGDEETNSNGEFISYIIIRDSTAGVHIITVTVSDNEVESEFIVEPEITLSSTSGESESKVEVKGTGYGRRKDIVIYFNNVGLTNAVTDSRGNFNTSFIVPKLDAGIYNIEAEDEDDNLGTAKFTIIVLPPVLAQPTSPPLQPQQPPIKVNTSFTSGGVGTDIIITGTGFEARGRITIRYDNAIVSEATADANGIFMATFTIPVSKYGIHTITVSDDKNIEELEFTVESDVPPVPAQLIPQPDTKVMPPVSFDWDDVDDDSRPVTYILQIANNDEFLAASIVLEKDGLTKSEYAVTEAEAMKLVAVDKPYYWRVKAADGASNEGDWSGAIRFYIITPSIMPNWLIYILILLGVLLLFSVIVWWYKRYKGRKSIF